MKRAWMIVLCLVFSLAFVSGVWADSSEKIVKIGLVGSFTGPLGAMGQTFKNGAMVAQKQINEEGNFIVGGQKYKLEFVEWDDRTDPKMAVAGVNKLMDQDGIKVFLGPMASSATMACQPITEPRKAIILCASIADNVIRPGIKYTARGITASSWGAEIMVNFLVNVMGVKTVAFITENARSGLSQEKAAKTVFERLGTKIVGRELYEAGTTDFFTPLTKLKADNPDVLLIATTYPEPAALIIKQTREIGWPVQTADFGGAATGAFFEIAGKACEGHLAKVALHKLDPGPELVKVTGMSLDRRKKFVEGMKQMFPKANPFDLQSMIYYDYTNLLVEAMKAAGTLEDTDKIMKALLNTDYKGVCQQYNFMANGQNRWLGTFISALHPDGSGDYLAYGVPKDETFQKWDIPLIGKVKTIKEIRAERGY